MSMKSFNSHFKSYVFRGILASIPIGLSYFVIRFFYVFVDKKVTRSIDDILSFHIPGLGIIMVIGALYLIGYFASNVLGKSFLRIVEAVFNKIPILKTTYQVGKQISLTLSLPERQVFKRVVMVELRPGVGTLGFVTGSVQNHKTHRTLMKVFIPSVPNPTSGFMFFVDEKDAVDMPISVEKALETIVSGGIIGVTEIHK